MTSHQSYRPIHVNLCCSLSHTKNFSFIKGSSCLLIRSNVIFFFSLFPNAFLSFLEPDTEKPAPGCLANGLGLQM
ncbi:hypothetical protein BDW68DRAFT_82104 [Aspergillus falconensis]